MWGPVCTPVCYTDLLCYIVTGRVARLLTTLIYTVPMIFIGDHWATGDRHVTIRDTVLKMCQNCSHLGASESPSHKSLPLGNSVIFLHASRATVRYVYPG